MILLYNYNEVIKPRSEILRTKKKEFKLDKAFTGSDGRFCHVWHINPKVLKKEQNKRKKEVNDEKERLWVYVDQL